MANKSWYEMLLLVCGGCLLVLGSVRGGIHTFEYMGAHDVLAVPDGTLGAGPAYVGGMIVANVFVLAIGIGLLWLAWAKRARRGLAQPGV